MAWLRHGTGGGQVIEPTVYPSVDADGRFILSPGRRYGWQMLPGYTNGYSPYFSPIRVERVVPRKTGAGWLDIEFYNAFYAEGVQDFHLSVRILIRGENYLVCAIDGPGSSQRTAVISSLSMDWLRDHCREFVEKISYREMEGLAKSEMDYFLNMAFSGSLRPSQASA